MNVLQLSSRLRWIAKQLVDESDRWPVVHVKRDLRSAAKQCMSQSMTLRNAPEGSSWHEAGLALYDEATNVLVRTMTNRTPNTPTERTH